MRLSLSGAFADAIALWNANRDLLVRIAGVFFFLPAFADYLFVRVEIELPVPDSSLPLEQRQQMLLDFYQQAFPKLAPILAVISIGTMLGSALIFAMLLAPGQRSLGEGLLRVGKSFPAMLVAWLLTGVLLFGGFSLFIIPGLYLAGRTFTVLPILIAEPERGPFGALVEGINRTRGHGWLLFLLIALMFIASTIAAMVPASLLSVTGQDSAPAAIPYALVAVVAAGGALAQALLQAAAYRGLSPRQGM